MVRHRLTSLTAYVRVFSDFFRPDFGQFWPYSHQVADFNLILQNDYELFLYEFERQKKKDAK